MIRPMGVVSKKAIGARNTFWGGGREREEILHITIQHDIPVGPSDCEAVVWPGERHS